MDLSDLYGLSGKSLPHADTTSARVAHRRPTDIAALKNAVGSPILDAGQLVISGMRLTTGWGDPEDGDVFERAATRFDAAAATLATAHPTADWEGAGSQAYAVANHQQAGRTDAIAVLDRGVHRVVSRQARQVAIHRDNLDEQSNFLADLSYTTWALALIPGVGKAAKATVELAAVATALQMSGQELHLLSQEVSENAAELNQLATQYTTLTVPESPPLLDRDLRADDDVQDDTPTGTEDPSPPDTAPVDDPDTVAPLGAAGGPSRAASPGAPPVVAMPAPAVAGHGAPAGSQPPAAMPSAQRSDPLSGMTSAFGAIGGVVGAIVAPLTAAVAGAAGAAGQALSALTDAGPDIPEEDKDAPATETIDAATTAAEDEPLTGDSTEAVSSVDSESATGPPPSTSAPVEAVPAPAEAEDRRAPAAPPAATRPPQ